MEQVISVTRIRGKVRLVIGSETITLPAPLYRERPLQEGEEVDLEEYDRWLLLHQYRPALDYAVMLLGQRAWATGELQQKLQRLGYRPQTIEMVIYKLSSNNLINDADFARSWAQSRASRKLGPARITQELRRKGITREDAEEAVEELDDEAMAEHAVQLAARALAKAKPGEDRRKTMQRVTAMLVRKGYSFSQAHDAIRQAGEDDLDEES